MAKIVIKVNGSLWTSDPIYSKILEAADKGKNSVVISKTKFIILKDTQIGLFGDREIETISEKA